jgi:hypothetical protein
MINRQDLNCAVQSMHVMMLRTGACLSRGLSSSCSQPACRLRRALPAVPLEGVWVGSMHVPSLARCSGAAVLGTGSSLACC